MSPGGGSCDRPWLVGRQNSAGNQIWERAKRLESLLVNSDEIPFLAHSGNKQ